MAGEELQDLQTAVVVLLIIAYVFLCPVLIYSSCKFGVLWWKNNSFFIRNRDPLAILIPNALVLFNTSVGNPIHMLYHVNSITLTHAIILDAFLSLSHFLFLNFFAVKSWLLLYRQRYQFTIENHQWHETIHGIKSDWYLQKKSTFGNVEWWLKYIVLPLVILETTFEIIRVQIGEMAMLIINTLEVFLPLSLILYCCWYSRKFYDVYRIRTEIYAQCMLFVGALVVYTIFIFIFKPLTENHMSEEKQNSAKDLAVDMIDDGTFYWFALVQVLYPLWLTYKWNAHSLENNASNDSSVHLLNVIKDDELFPLFIQYLVKAFCMQNLSFIAELIQIKHAFQLSLDTKRNTKQTNAGSNVILMETVILLDDHEIEDEHGDTLTSNLSKIDELLPEYPTEKIIRSYLYGYQSNDDNRLCIELPAILPNSELLMNENLSFTERLHGLYHKYIVEGAEYEIDIGNDERENLKQIFGDEYGNNCESDQNVKYYCTLDAAAIEAFELLMEKFVQFQESYEYSQYINSEEYQIRSKCLNT